MKTAISVDDSLMELTKAISMKRVGRLPGAAIAAVLSGLRIVFEGN